MSDPILNKIIETPAEMKKSFWGSPMDALFNRKTISVVTGYCMSWLANQAWQKKGIPYLKSARRCLYRKSDVLKWLDKNFEEKNVSSQD